MSWSISKSGPALEVARLVEQEGEVTQRYLRSYTGDKRAIENETALHARATGMLVVACHAAPSDSYVVIAASGHYDGRHHHVRLEFDSLSAAPVSNVPGPTTLNLSSQTPPVVELTEQTAQEQPERKKKTIKRLY